MPVHDMGVVRVEKQLGSALRMMQIAVAEAESWKYQDLANDVQEHLFALRSIHENLVRQGRRYQRPLPTVRS